MELGILILILINIAGVAFSYGKLSQKVKDHCNRLTAIEQQFNHVSTALNKLTLEIAIIKDKFREGKNGT